LLPPARNPVLAEQNAHIATGPRNGYDVDKRQIRGAGARAAPVGEDVVTGRGDNDHRHRAAARGCPPPVPAACALKNGT
jgi:hypothetical protein